MPRHFGQTATTRSDGLSPLLIEKLASVQILIIDA
jgi:hypothetical protein